MTTERGASQQGLTSAGGCSVPECLRPHEAKGYCGMHYQRARHGQPLDAPVWTDHTEAEWFWMSVDQSAGPDACWPWTRYRAAQGYGRDRHGFTHRYALSLALGRPLRRGMEAAHSCDNPGCCNPRHLREADRLDNMRDAVDRRLMPAGERNVHARLTAADVRAIRASPARLSELGARYGVSPTHIRRIVTGKRWREAA